MGADIYMALGDEEHALQALEHYREHPLQEAQYLRWLYRISLDPLRDDPRCEAVLAANGVAGTGPVRLPPGAGGAARGSAPSE